MKRRALAGRWLCGFVPRFLSCLTACLAGATICAAEADPHQLAAIQACFREVGFDPEEMPQTRDDTAILRLVAQKPDDLERGGTRLQIVAALYLNETDATASLANLPQPISEPVGLTALARKVDSITLAGGHAAVVLRERKASVEGTTCYATGMAAIHLTCGNISVRVRQEAISDTAQDMDKVGTGRRTKYEVPSSCNAEGWRLADSADAAARTLAARFHNALIANGACHSLNRPSAFHVPLRTARPINSDHVDRFLDHLGSLLRAAADASNGRSLTALRRRAAPQAANLAPSDLNWQQAADLARSVFVQVRAMQTQANRGMFSLTRTQTNRLKAFLRWIDWIVKRNDGNVVWREVPTTGNAGLGSGSAMRLCWKVTDATAGHRWEEFPLPPKYPFDAPIREEVPPIDIRTLVDDDVDTILQQEYAKAFVKTVAQVADMYFTYGLIYSTYLYLNNDECAPLAMTVLCMVPRAGPVLAAMLSTIYTASHWQQQSWDERYGSLSGIFLAAMHVGARSGGPTEKAVVSKGFNESPVPASVAEQLPAKYTLRAQAGASAAGELVILEATIPESLEARPTGEPVKVVLKARAIKVEGRERFFHAETGEPILAPDEPGYMAWKVLTGRHFGKESGMPSLIQAVKGTAYEGEAQAIVDAFMDPAADRNALNERAVDLFNRMIDAKDIARTSGYYPAAPKAPANANYSLQLRNAVGEVHLGEISIGRSGRIEQVNLLPPGPEISLPESTDLGKALKATPAERNRAAFNAIQDLFDSPEEAAEFQDEFVRYLRNQPLSSITDVYEVLGELRDIQGVKSYVKTLPMGDTKTSGALWELRWAYQNKTLISEMQIFENGKQGADFLLKDGRVVEVKGYDWDNPFYRDRQKLNGVALGWAKQLRLRALRYPQSPIELHVVDLAKAPLGPDGLSLKQLIVSEFKQQAAGINLDRITIKDFRYK